MDDITPTTSSVEHITTPPERDGDQRWTRPATGRLLAGVAAGISRHSDLPPWVIRALFVVTAFAGGFGIAAYLVGWAVMPPDGQDLSISDEVRQRLDGSRTSTETLGIVLMGVAAILVLATTGIVRAPMLFAAVLAVAGIALIRPAGR